MTADLDTIYNELGGFGKFQFFNILFVTLAPLFCGFMVSDHIFTASRLPHRCAIPECDGPQPMYEPSWITNAVPTTNNGFDDCSRFANISSIPGTPPSGDVCPANLFNRNEIVECDTYVYGRTNSVVYDFGLECQDWLRALAGTLGSVGALVGLPISGYMADRWGRKTTVLICCFNMALFGFIRSFSVNYGMYVTFQFLQTMLGSGAFSSGYVLAAETVGSRHRVATSASYSSMFAVGQVLLGVIASAITEWRTLSMVLHGSIVISLVNYWLLTESARWLISRNRRLEARKVLEKIARINGKELNEKLANEVLSPQTEQKTDLNGEQDNTNLFFRIIRSPVLLRRCCTTPIWWITTTFVYYGLSINSVSLSDNMYTNYIATAAIEIPGYWVAILLLDRIGRRLTLFCGFTLCAVCCFGFVFTPEHLFALSLTLYLIGKFAISEVFTSLYLFTSELYPTRHRHSLLSFSSTIGRVGSVLAPLTPPLMNYWTGMPSVMFGSMGILSAVLVLTQPETKGINLPYTIEDAENIGVQKTE